MTSIVLTPGSDEEDEGETVALTAIKPSLENGLDIFAAILKDDVIKMKAEFDKLSAVDRTKVVNQPMKYSDPVHTSYTPIQLACCMGNKTMFTYLLSQGANVTSINDQDKNIVYMLIDCSKYRPKMAVEMYQFVMRSCSSTEKMTLLDHRHERCNPLLYAIKHGELRMANTIVNTGGIYRHVISKCGTYSVVKYDLQIAGADSHQCPIRALLKLGLNQFKTPTNRDIISRRPWATWLSQAWSEYVWIAFWWFFFRLAHLVFLTFSCVQRPLRLANDTSPLTVTFPKTHRMTVVVEYLLLVYSLCALLPNVIRLCSPSCLCSMKRGLVRWCKSMCRTVHRIKRPEEKRFTHGRLFWLLSVLMHISYVWSFVLTYYRWASEDIALSLSVVLCYISMLFFCTLVPQLGHFSIIIEQTVKDILNFAFFYLFIQLGFSAAFYTLFQMDEVENFKSYPRTIFTVFHMTFDVVGMDTLQRAREPIAAILCFVIYVVIVVVALLNFLIAILSQTVAEITESRQIAFSLNRAAVAIFLQEYPFVRKLRKVMAKMLCCSNDISNGVCSVTIVEYLSEGGIESSTTYGRSDSVL